MIRQGRTIVLEGPFTTWDGSNLDEVKEIAGDRYAGIENGTVLVRGRDDENVLARLEQGQVVARFQDLVVTYGDYLGQRMVTEVTPDAE